MAELASTQLAPNEALGRAEDKVQHILPSYQDIDSDLGDDEGSDEDDDSASFGQGSKDKYGADDGSSISNNDLPDDGLPSALHGREVHGFKPGEARELLIELRESGLFTWLTRHVVERGVRPARLLLLFDVEVPVDLESDLTDQQVLKVLQVVASKFLRRRERVQLPHGNTLDDVFALLRTSRNIVVLSGAGVSTSCGIPDFRSKNGLYARLSQEYPDLGEPEEMFDMAIFRERPFIFYSFAKNIFPSNFTPSPCHRFVKLLEDRHALLRNYTQNIDGLFEKAGVTKLLNCHGSFATASCIKCKRRFDGKEIEPDVFESRIPLCPDCHAAIELVYKEFLAKRMRGKKKKKKGNGGWQEEDSDDERQVELEHRKELADGGIVKPDIVFFGEKLSDEFDQCLLADREKIDLLLVVGTSLSVAPVSQLVAHIPHSVPQILINRDPIRHATFDVSLLGDADCIVRYLCDRLRESDDEASAWDLEAAGETTETPKASSEPQHVPESFTYLFPGAKQLGESQVSAPELEQPAKAESRDAASSGEHDDERASKRQRIAS